MFKMARDPFEDSRWNRNFYLRINDEIKKVSFLKGFYVRFSGSHQVKNLNLITTHVPTIVSTRENENDHSLLVSTFICCWVLT